MNGFFEAKLKIFHVWQVANAVVLFALLLQPSLASAACMFTTATGVGFGAYNVFTTLANTSGTGNIGVNCNDNGASSFVVTLSTGQSHTYASRIMRSGGNILNYNLYTSAARTVVWGDGTGGSNVMTASRRASTTLNVFGEIPSGQDAMVGTYTDNIIAIINF